MSDTIYVPSFEDLMICILRLMSDDVVRKNRQIKVELINFMNLSREQLDVRNNNGNSKYMDNVGFAVSYLMMSGLLDRPSRAMYKISNKGKELLNQNIEKITVNYLKEISPEFKERMQYHKKEETMVINNTSDEINPEELMAIKENQIKETIKSELLNNLIASSPSFFERVCRDLLLALGYGYDDKESGIVTQGARDGGIDAIIYGDKLGLEKIYIQAKKYDSGTIGRPLIQAFKGAINNSKGVFITTSSYSNDALEYASRHDNLILIDGNKLVDLLYEAGVGVRNKNTFVTKEVDIDYFERI